MSEYKFLDELALQKGAFQKGEKVWELGERATWMSLISINI